MTFRNSVYKVQAAIVAIFTGLFVSSAGWATTFYVDATQGNDSNAGTSSAPWKTIRKAADNMVAGDTAIVRAASSSERVQVTRSGTSGAPITYQAEGTVVMKGFTIRASYIHVTGFEITDTDDNDTDGVGIYINGSYNEASNNYIHDVARQGFAVYQNKNILRNNRIFRAGHTGMWLYGADHLVEGNDISRIIQYPAKWSNPPSWIDADGIVIDGRGFIIRRNYIHDIRGDDPGNDDPHIDTFQIAGNAQGHDLIIEQNTLSIPRSSKRCYQVAMISGSPGQVYNITFRNNIIYSMCRGLNIWGNESQVTGVKVLNNTWYDLDDYSVELHDAPGAVVKNNIYRSMGKSYVSLTNSSTDNIGYNLLYQTGGTTYPHDLVGVDPKFVNLSGKDFHPQSISPAINAGTTLAEVTKDYDGNARPQGGAYDIGAYEYVSSTSSTITASPATVPAGGTVTVSWSGVSSPTVTDWIGRYLPRDPDTSYASDWKYTSSCSKNAGATAQSSGSCTFTTPATAGTYEFRLFANNGYTRLAMSNSVTVTAPDTTPPSIPANLTAEAESGSLTSPMRKVANSSASGGYHVELPSGAGEDVGKVTFTLSIPVAGTYVVWGRVTGPGTGSNSFYAQMDNGVKYLWDIPVSSSFVWHKVGNRLGSVEGSTPVSFNLSKGSHTFVIFGREMKARLDKLIITNNLNYTPTTVTTKSALVSKPTSIPASTPRLTLASQQALAHTPTTTSTLIAEPTLTSTQGSTSTPTPISWGISEDVPVPGDYDGDGRADVAVWRPSEGNWYLWLSTSASPSIQPWGAPGDKPVPGDYNGDGRMDMATWQPSTGTWHLLNSLLGGPLVEEFGKSSDIPVSGDYDGDGMTDIAIFRPSAGAWGIKPSGGGDLIIKLLGQDGDIPVPKDYDGDGKTDIALWRPREGNWYIMLSRGGSQVMQWGQAGDMPVPKDYDGDGITDLAIWRPSEGKWYISR